ncbi:hypothetical protein BH23GEM10_BH23GEM10_13250 [soil metagenome]
MRDTVEGLGGRVWVEPPSADHAGSTFRIALPSRRGSDPHAGDADDSDDADGGSAEEDGSADVAEDASP